VFCPIYGYNAPFDRARLRRGVSKPGFRALLSVVANRELQRFQVALKAFVLRGGRLLMVREADGPQYWELPGGRIEVGEEGLSPVAVLRRELAEELGGSFACEVADPVTAWVRPPDPPRRSVSVFLVGYLCRHRAGEVLLSDEHCESRWVTRAESAKLQLAPGYAPALAVFWESVRSDERG
jgi:8-oxo-dGTP pyrophosphatase MutT (NUDIX family)